MNEQLIKELLVKAGVYDCDPSDPDFKLSDVGEEYLKLVELVAKECIGLCKDFRSTAARESAEYIREAMQEHFGLEVEE